MNFFKNVCTQRFFYKSIKTLDLKRKPSINTLQTCLYSYLTQNSRSHAARNSLELIPKNSVFIPSCGMKVRGQLQLRCRDCYFERKDGQLYVFCSSYPRHKQRALRKKEKYTWILTHCSQSKLRPY